MIFEIIILSLLFSFILLLVNLLFIKHNYLIMFLYFELLLLMASLVCLVSSFYYNDNMGFLVVISLLVLAACEASIGLILLILNNKYGLDMSEVSQFKLKK